MTRFCLRIAATVIMVLSVFVMPFGALNIHAVGNQGVEAADLARSATGRAALQKISLSDSSGNNIIVLTLKKGDKYTLKVATSPTKLAAKDLSWYSENSAIEVKNGVISVGKGAKIGDTSVVYAVRDNAADYIKVVVGEKTGVNQSITTKKTAFLSSSENLDKLKESDIIVKDY